MRPDHWVKNLLILPGFVLGLNFVALHVSQIPDLIITFIGASLAASANYTINEYLDRTFDSHHPRKKQRRSVLGKVTLKGIVVQYLILSASAIILFLSINVSSFLICVLFLTNGLIYNLPSIRLKEKKYLDIFSESFNSPLRLAWGWYSLVVNPFPPSSALIAFWLTGIFLMALKRYVELSEFSTVAEAKAYRVSLSSYSKIQLIRIAMMSSFSAAMLMGIYIIRNRIEFIIVLPFVVWIFSEFTVAAIDGGKIIHSPETMVKSKKIFTALVTLSLLACILYFVDIPILSDVLRK